MPSSVPDSSSHWKRVLLPGGISASTVVRAVPSSNVLPLPSRIVPPPSQLLTVPSWGPRFVHYVHSPRRSINQFLSIEMLTDIFLYAVEAYQMTPYQLVAVCRRWRNVINGMSHLWSTLRIGTYTQIENIDIWLDRSRQGLLTVKIDPRRDIENCSDDKPYTGLQHAFGSVDRWQNLVITSSPTPEAFGDAVDFRTVKPFERLTSLELGQRCQDSATLTHLLDHISKTAIILSDMSLCSPCAIASFLQPPRGVVLSMITTLVIDGKGISEPISILPFLGNLQIFEATSLPILPYETDTSLPFLSTLRQLKLRGVRLQWMAGREFKCLEDCTIIHALGQEEIQLGINMPGCKTLTYQGHPISTLQYFHTPQAKELVLHTHDTKRKRVQWHLDLFRLDGKLSQLHTLHLTLSCSEGALTSALEHMEHLQELVLSIAYPSSSLESFLMLLAAEPSSQDWPKWDYVYDDHKGWMDWCSSQTWYTDMLPSLRSLCIQSAKGFSQSQCLENCPIFRYLAWTRAQRSPPLEHLKVWEGRGTSDDIVMEYISTSYLDKHLGISTQGFDQKIIRGIFTQKLLEVASSPLFDKFHSTLLFRQLQVLVLHCHGCDEVDILPHLEQIKKLTVHNSTIPAYSPDIHLPLAHTLQYLKLEHSSCPWMSGRVFKALKRINIHYCPAGGRKDPQLDIPACTKLGWFEQVTAPSFSCVNLQRFSWSNWEISDMVNLRSLFEFLPNCPCLQHFDCCIPYESDSVIWFLFCHAWEQGVWKVIRTVDMELWGLSGDAVQNLIQKYEHDQQLMKWWKVFTVSCFKERAAFEASM